MKLFTVEEANRSIPALRTKLEDIRALYLSIDLMRTDANAAAEASVSGGGMPGGTAYVKTLYRIGKLSTELHDQGVQLKDHRRGLVDFPTLRNGRVVLLCWQLGEGDSIEWWHENEAGFAGRQPL